MTDGRCKHWPFDQGMNGECLRCSFDSREVKVYERAQWDPDNYQWIPLGVLIKCHKAADEALHKAIADAVREWEKAH